MPASTYFDRPGLSSHALADFINRGAGYYAARHVHKTIGDKDSSAYRMGRAVHSAALEPDKFGDDFSIYPEDVLTASGSLSTSKAAREKIAGLDEGIDWLLPKEHAQAQAIAGSVRAHPIVQRLMEKGAAEVETYQGREGLPHGLKGCADWAYMDEFEAYGFDLKTTSGTLAGFVDGDFWTWRYDRQLAFYRRLFNWQEVFLAVVEKAAPYCVGCFRVDPEVLDAAEAENEAAISQLIEHYATGEWPTHHAELINIKPRRA